MIRTSHTLVSILLDVDFATVAEGFGVTGMTVRAAADLDAALERAKEITAAGKPVLIDIKILNERLLPVEQFPHRCRAPAHGVFETFDQFVRDFHAEDLEPCGEILDRHGVASK